MLNNQEAFNQVVDIVKNQSTTQKKQGLAKTVSIMLLIGVFIMGVVGSFEFAHFTMSSYVQFLNVAMWPLMLFLLSIGAGSIVHTAKKGNEKIVVVENKPKEVKEEVKEVEEKK